MVDEDSIKYFEQRAQEEKAAAARAENEAARQIHLELANEYLSRAGQKPPRRKLGIAAS